MSAPVLDRTAIPVPTYLKDRPLHNGFVVPWFVTPAEPLDFRVVSPSRLLQAHKGRLCWVCGKPRSGQRGTFVIGPMCTVNRISAEPPNHRECARYSVQVCPFLSNPGMRRSPRALPEGHIEPPGEGIMRNPGVSALWLTDRYTVIKVDGGLLFRLGAPLRVEWWAHGRRATRAEVQASLDSGYPLLRETAEAEGNGAVGELEGLYAKALRYLPGWP